MQLHFCLHTAHGGRKVTSSESTKEISSSPLISPNWVTWLLLRQSLWLGECPALVGLGSHLWSTHFDKGSGISHRIIKAIPEAGVGSLAIIPSSSWALPVTDRGSPWLHLCASQWHNSQLIFAMPQVAELRSPTGQESASTSEWWSWNFQVFWFQSSFFFQQTTLPKWRKEAAFPV
jgi:hypothetical protein